MWFIWSRFYFYFSNPSVYFSSCWGPFPVSRLLLVLPSFLCFTALSALARSKYFFFLLSFNFTVFLIIIIIIIIEVFVCNSTSWWLITWVWVTGSLFKSTGLFSVFRPISIMLWFGWAQLILLFVRLPVAVPILWWLYQEHQIQLVSSSLSCSTIFQFTSKVHVLIFPFQFYLEVIRDSKVHNSASSLFLFIFIFLLTISRSGCLAEIRWFVCISKSQRSLCVSFSRAVWLLLLKKSGEKGKKRWKKSAKNHKEKKLRKRRKKEKETKIKNKKIE